MTDTDTMDAVSDSGSEAALEAPSLELVRRADRELSWSERFTVMSMNSMRGNVSREFYNMRSVVAYAGEEPRMGGCTQKGQINWLDIGQLAVWIRTTLGDVPLADAIVSSQEGREGSSWDSQMQPVRTLLSQRMQQYDEVLEKADAEAVA